jgi:hypothetical protein
MAEYLMGVDVGQANDYTAIVVAERRIGTRILEPPRSATGYGDQEPREAEENSFDVVHLERLRDLSYSQQIDLIAERFRELLGYATARDGDRVIFENHVTLLVDATGVGKPILDALRKAELRPVGVMITAGETVNHGDGVYRVPKRILVSHLQVVLQSGRLKIARDLPLSAVLVKEFKGFRVQITLSGHAKFGNDVGAWREADHDDLVLATSLCTWWGESRKRMSNEALMTLAGW